MSSLTNKKAKFDYEFLNEYTAGIILTGSEVKSIRNGSISLLGSYISIDNNEVYLKQACISRLETSSRNHEEYRNIKLLLNRREIDKLHISVTQKGLSIVPYKIFIENGKFKLQIFLAKGKTNYDKRHAIKERDLKRYG